MGYPQSFYDTLRTLRTLRPSLDSVRMSRSLSAINGLMGSQHDTLVIAKARNAASYDDIRFALPDPSRIRLAALVDCGAAD